MWRRLAQILGLLLCMLGWGSVGCTLAMDRWRVAQVGGQGVSSVVVTAWFWSDLWRDCYEDSTGLVNCVDLGGLWTLKSYIQAVRGLLLFGLCLGAIGTVLAFFGMECTHLGGNEKTNNSLLVTASALHLLGCASVTAGYCLYLNRVLAAFLHSKADPSKLSYEIGPPLYLGLVGGCLTFLGCAVHSATVLTVHRPERRHWIPFKSKNQEGKEAFRRKEHTYGGCRRSNQSQTLSVYKMASTVIV